MYVKEKIIFFTEKEGTFHVFAFFPNENALYSAAFSQAFLKGMARKFNFQNMQLLLSWIRNEISNNRFILKSSNSGNINFTIGLNSPTQPSFLLSSSLNIVEFIISISNALLSSQTYIADLERGNEKSLDQLRSVCVINASTSVIMIFFFGFFTELIDVSIIICAQC